MGSRGEISQPIAPFRRQSAVDDIQYRLLMKAAELAFVCRSNRLESRRLTILRPTDEYGSVDWFLPQTPPLNTLRRLKDPAARDLSLEPLLTRPREAAVLEPEAARRPVVAPQK